MKPTDDVSQFPENGMSPTPRTDEQVFDWTTEDGSDIVFASFARELETELAAMKARAEKAEAELATLHMLYASEKSAKIERGDMYIETLARAEKAEADTARMDWLEKESPEDWGIRSINRAAIDAAMKESSK